MNWTTLLIVLALAVAWWFTRSFRSGYEAWLKSEFGGLAYGFALLAWALSPLLIGAGLAGIGWFDGQWNLFVGGTGFTLLSTWFLYEMWRFVKFCRQRKSADAHSLGTPENSHE